VGLLRDLLYGPERSAVIVRAASPPTPRVPETSQPPGLPYSVESIIADAIAERTAAFSLANAMQMPAVIRGVQLICSLIAQFAPIAYRGGVPVPDQPRLLTQPAPFGTRYQFIYQTIYSQLAMPGSANTGGDAYWLIVDRDDEGIARSAVVVDPREVTIEWDDRHFLPVYTWRGKEMDRDFVHLTIGRPPGELHGRSPLVAGLPALAVVAAAEAYALGFFGTSGVPSVTITVPGKLSADEALRLKAQWVEAHSGPAATPAVLSNGMEADYPPVDAQRAQLQESRAYGATITARLLGIPAPLLHVETSGATITYNNAGGALDEFVRATAAPVYLAPLEGYYSELLPRTQTVRFDTGELNRIDVAGRVSVYAEAITAGIMTPAEARLNEGWPTDAPIASAPAYAATPDLPAMTVEVPSV
jgi:HK97 family phage portal protein